MQQTETYKLNLMEGSDTFSPQPINENMEKLEAALEDRPKVALGSYVGSGIYGVNSPNTLTFGFEPKLLVVSSGNTLMIALWDNQYAVCYTGSGYASNYVNSTYGWYDPITWDGQTVSWYHADGNTSQLSQPNTTYRYIAFG